MYNNLYQCSFPVTMSTVFLWGSLMPLPLTHPPYLLLGQAFFFCLSVCLSVSCFNTVVCTTVNKWMNERHQPKYIHWLTSQSPSIMSWNPPPTRMRHCVRQSEISWQSPPNHVLNKVPIHQKKRRNWWFDSSQECLNSIASKWIYHWKGHKEILSCLFRAWKEVPYPRSGWFS